MEGKDWILIICDDGSFDGTREWLANYKSSATKYIFKGFPKAVYLGEAKNRAFKIALEYRDEYEAILVMDGDDLQNPSRISKLLPFAVENDYPLVVSDHIRLGPFDDNELRIKSNEMSCVFHPFGLWASVFHSSLIDPEKDFYHPQLNGFDDSSKFSEWLSRGILAKHYNCLGYTYLRRNDSIYTPLDKIEDQRRKQKCLDIRYELLAGKRIDLGIKIDLTLYTVFREEDNLDKFIEILGQKMMLVEKFPNIEYIIIDESKQLKFSSAVQFPYVREITCRILNIIESKGRDFRELTNNIINLSRGEKLAFCTNLSEVNQFLIASLLDADFLTIKSIREIMCFRKDFLKKINDNNQNFECIIG